MSTIPGYKIIARTNIISRERVISMNRIIGIIAIVPDKGFAIVMIDA